MNSGCGLLIFLFVGGCAVLSVSRSCDDSPRTASTRNKNETTPRPQSTAKPVPAGDTPARAVESPSEELPATPAPTPRGIPAGQFHPVKVQISKAMTLRRIDEHGLISSEISEGSEVDVLSLKGDVLSVGRGDIKGSIAVADTDFLARAIATEDVAIAQRERDEKKRREMAPIIEARRQAAARQAAKEDRRASSVEKKFEVLQVISGGILCMDDDSRRFYIEGKWSNMAEGQRYSMRVIRDGVFEYRTVLGAPSTIERYVPLD